MQKIASSSPAYTFFERIHDGIRRTVPVYTSSENGKPRGRYARVAFELALRNLELVTPAPYDRSRSWTTTLLILLHPMDSETQYEPPNATALSPAGTQPR